MADRNQLDLNVRRVIAAQIAQRLPQAPGAALASTPDAKVDLGESFEVQAYAGEPADAPLRDRLRPTGEWRHQILRDGAPVLQAASLSAAGGPPTKVVEVVSSPLAGRMAAAIDYIDAHVPGDLTVSLFFVPEHFVAAFFLRSPDGPEQDQALVLAVGGTDAPKPPGPMPAQAFVEWLDTLPTPWRPVRPPA